MSNPNEFHFRSMTPDKTELWFTAQRGGVELPGFDKEVISWPDALRFAEWIQAQERDPRRQAQAELWREVAPILGALQRQGNPLSAAASLDAIRVKFGMPKAELLK